MRQTGSWLEITEPNNCHRSPSKRAIWTCLIGAKSVGLVLTVMPGCNIGSAATERACSSRPSCHCGTPSMVPRAPARNPPTRDTFLWTECDVNSREAATGYDAFRKRPCHVRKCA